MQGVWRYFERIGSLEAACIPCPFDDCKLESETQTEKRNAVDTGVIDGGNLALGPATPESTGNYNCTRKRVDAGTRKP